MTDHADIDHTGLTGVGGGGMNSGTSFPGTPAANDLFYRTDRALLYFYDGTRWLTTTLYSEVMGIFEGVGPFSTTGTKFRSIAAFGPTYDSWLVDFRTWTYVSGTNNGTNYWTVAFVDDATVTRATFNTSADSGSTDYYKITAIGALLGTARKQVLVNCTKTLSPDPLYISAMFTYRLVG